VKKRTTIQTCSKARPLSRPTCDSASYSSPFLQADFQVLQLTVAQATYGINPEDFVLNIDEVDIILNNDGQNGVPPAALLGDAPDNTGGFEDGDYIHAALDIRSVLLSCKQLSTTTCPNTE
jgi:hypothetical protein